MPTSLLIGKDMNGTTCDTIVVSQDKYAITLSAGIASSLTVPANVDSAFFAYGSAGDVWVNLQDTASIPTSTFSKTNSELNPVSRFVVPGSTISCICSTVNSVQISFYNTQRGNK